jgi:hypothetical protein
MLWLGGKSILQGLKPHFFVRPERSKPEGLAYLEASADAKTTASTSAKLEEKATTGVSEEAKGECNGESKTNAGVSPLRRQKRRLRSR